jgi:hypothetical protein
MEVGWYRDIADDCGAICAKSYHADIAENEQEFVLLLEDMAPASQGDQLAGGSLVQVATTLNEAAALHSFQPDGGFDDYRWLHHGEGNSDFLKNALPNGYPVFRERFSTLLSSDILDLGQELIDRIDAYVAHEPLELAITHGDMRLDNILFREDGGLAALVDWQTCSLGNPANDVAYMIGTSFADPGDQRLAPCRSDRTRSQNVRRDGRATSTNGARSGQSELALTRQFAEHIFPDADVHMEAFHRNPLVQSMRSGIFRNLQPDAADSIDGDTDAAEKYAVGCAG